jgi:hypothetical protein
MVTQMFFKILFRELLKSAKNTIMRRPTGNFSRVEGEGFTVRRGSRDALLYQEPGHEFLVSALEGGGYSIIIEHMGDADVTLNNLPVAQKLRIAKNIRRALLDHGVDAEIQYEHRVVRDE